MNAADWVEPLDRLWAAPAVTIIGGNERGGTTGTILKNLRSPASTFTGRISIVNRAGGLVYDVPAVTSIEEIEGELGLVWILVPTAHVASVLADIEPRRPRGVVVFPGGYGEVGDWAAQHALRDWSHRNRIPLFGPQSLGFARVHSRLNPLAMPMRTAIVPGEVGLVSQSGGFLGSMITQTVQQGAGVHSAFSLGGEAALGYVDLATNLVEDPGLRALLIYAENVGSLGDLARLARRAAELEKPLVLLAAGMSEAGQRLAKSHTGALATPRRLLQGIADQFGVVLARDLDEMFAALDALRRSGFRRLTHGSPGFFTGSGGSAVIYTDAISEAGFALAGPSADTRTELYGRPDTADLGNPYDMGAGLLGRPDEFTRKVGAFVGDGSYDIGVYMFHVPDPEFAPHVFWEQEALRLTTEAGLVPVFSTLTAKLDTGEAERLSPGWIPAFGMAETLVKVGALVQWAKGDAGEEIASPVPVDPDAGTRVATGSEVRRLLESVPLDWPDEWTAGPEDDVAAVLGGAPGPFVAKAEVGLAHRAAAGAVVVNIPTVDAAVAAVAYLRTLFGSTVTLSEFVPHDGEYFVGLSRTADGQPAIAVGPGGSGVEDKNVGFRLLGLSARQVQALVAEYAPDLAGNDAFAKVVLALADVMADPDVESIDLNPLVVTASGAIAALDAKVHRHVRRR